MAKRTTEQQLVLVLLVMVGAALLVSTIYLTSIRNVQVIPIQLRVSNTSGFNIANEKVYFGTVPPGGHAKREILIPNRGNHVAVIHTIATGEVAQWVQIDHPWIAIAPGTQRTISVHLWLPKEAAYSNYTGNVELVTYGLG